MKFILSRKIFKRDIHYSSPFIIGKGQNIWDNLTHSRPYLTTNKANGDVACDSYHLFKEDVILLKNLGVSNRFFFFKRLYEMFGVLLLV